MSFQSLLLGSVAAMIVVGGAQAADLTVAEPVDYVKVCDAFGKGFFYSPGTDTCIKIGGYLKFSTAVGDTELGTYNSIYPNSNWSNFSTEASIQMTASSVTEFGNLTGWIDYRARTGNAGNFSETLTQAINAATNTAYVDTAWLQLGPVKAGRFDSLFDFGQGYTDTGAFSSDTKTDHIQFTYAVGAFGLSLSIEDQRDRGAVGNTGGLAVSERFVTDEFGYVHVAETYFEGGQDNVPDVVGAVSYASDLINAKLAAAYVNNAVDRTGKGTAIDPYNYQAKDGWALGGSVEFLLDSFSAGDKFQISASYGDNANSYTGISGGTSVAQLTGSFVTAGQASIAPGSSWNAFASYKHVWSPSVWSAVTGGYASYDGDGYWFGDYSVNAWRGVFSTQWTPVKGIDIMLDALYSGVDQSDEESTQDAWAVNLWLKRTW